MSETEGRDESRAIAVLSPETAARFMDMARTLPVEDGSQATERIVAMLLEGMDVDGLNAPFEGGGLEDYLGRTLVLDRAKVLPSRFRDGSGFFLFVEGVDAQTGEPVGFSTSSWAVCAQIIAANFYDLLPIRAVPERKEDPTAAGYYPEHLRVVATRAALPAAAKPTVDVG